MNLIYYLLSYIHYYLYNQNDLFYGYDLLAFDLFFHFREYETRFIQMIWKDYIRLSLARNQEHQFRSDELSLFYLTCFLRWNNAYWGPSSGQSSWMEPRKNHRSYRFQWWKLSRSWIYTLSSPYHQQMCCPMSYQEYSTQNPQVLSPNRHLHPKKSEICWYLSATLFLSPRDANTLKSSKSS